MPPFEFQPITLYRQLILDYHTKLVEGQQLYEIIK